MNSNSAGGVDWAMKEKEKVKFFREQNSDEMFSGASVQLPESNPRFPGQTLNCSDWLCSATNGSVRLIQ